MIDGIVFGVYLVGVFGLGLWVSRRQGTPENFFLAGHRLPWYAIALSLVATNVSSGTLVGLAGDGYRVGMAVGTLEWGALLGLYLLAFVFLPYYQRAGVYTTPEFLEKRYSPATRLLLAGIVLVFDMVIFMPFVLYTGGLFLHVTFDYPIFYCVLVIAAFAGVYTTFGGLGAVVWTDVVQGVFIFAGGAVVTLLALDKIGGVSELTRQAPEHLHVCLPSDHPTFPFPWTMIGGFFLITVYYWCHNQTIIQRTLGARTEWDGRMGVIGACFIKLLAPFVIVLPGILAFVLFPQLEDTNQALPKLITEIVPVGLRGLIWAFVVASLMSSADSGINSWATIFTNDFYHRIIDRKASPKRLVLVGRLASIVLLVVAVLCTSGLEKKPSILQHFLTTFAFLATPVIVVFMIGILWRGATSAAAITTFVTAPLICFVSQSLHKYVEWWPAQVTSWMVPAVAFTAFVMIVVSLFTPRKDPGSLKGLIWTPEDTLAMRSGLFRRRDQEGLAEASTDVQPSVWGDYRAWAALSFILLCAVIWWLR